MNRPEGISPEAWEKAREIGLNAYLNDFYVTEIAEAIQSSVEAERERCARHLNEGCTIVDGEPLDPAVPEIYHAITEGA